MNHYVLKVGPIRFHNNFYNSVIKRIKLNQKPAWGFCSDRECKMRKILNKQENNIIWLQANNIKNPIAVMLVDSITLREKDDPDNVDLGWDYKEYHYKINYTQFYWLGDTDINFIDIKGQTTFRKIKETRDLNILDLEINNIIKYCKVKQIIY